MDSSSAPAVALNTLVEDVPEVTSRQARGLRRLGIRTVSDLCRHMPLRYEKQFAESSIGELPLDGIGTTRGTILSTRWVPAGPGRRLQGRFEARLEDPSGVLDLNWFNCSFLRDQIHPGMVVRVSGKTTVYRQVRQMANPRWDRLDDKPQLPAAPFRLRPVYPATEQLPSAAIEHVVQRVLPALGEQLIDPLPVDILERRRMPALDEALRRVHMPQDPAEVLAARRRMAYNEMLLLQLGILMKRHYNRTAMEAPTLRWNEAIDEHIRRRFGFVLTAAQDRVIAQIVADLVESRPMNRLVQGDVGSGKTVVALYALLMAVAEKRQGALMAPTELLAEQHHICITNMLEGSNVRIALLTSSQGAPGSARRAALLGEIKSGQAELIVGTQALLTEAVRFADLAVVVTDEQHRFGVMQRARFRGSVCGGAGATGGRQRAPHNLIMTATPIPRTLSLAVFGDLDVSTIDQMPPGRGPIVTRVVAPSRADDVYRYVARRLDRADQAYVVVPAIDASGHESAAQLKTVREHATYLAERYCGSHRVASIHGRLKQQTRQSIMEQFRQGRIRVLVATTVIEVGVDVPNATIMVVEHAERFGLAQLHQLRGRIGRGADGRRSLCVFIADPATEEAAKRMQAIGTTTDGFKIAESDLKIRGMGEFFGTRQHGPTPLRVARIPEDLDLLEAARADARRIVDADPTLAAAEHKLLRGVLMRQYGESLGLIDVG